MLMKKDWKDSLCILVVQTHYVLVSGEKQIRNKEFRAVELEKVPRNNKITIFLLSDPFVWSQIGLG